MKTAHSSQTGQSSFVHDHSIERLWRHTPTNKFYAILKRGGRQIKRSLKARDRELARRRLEDLRQKVSQLANPKQALNSACRKANMPHFTNYSLRHFFVSNCIEAGADFATIAHWCGHKDGGYLIAKAYGHLRTGHSAAMAKRMTFDLAKLETEPANAVKMTATNA